MILRPRTHTLTIDVPLYLGDECAEDFDYYPVEEALRVVMAVSRLAVDGFVCGDVEVRIGTRPVTS